MVIAMLTPPHIPRFAPFFRIALAANYSSDVRREFLLFVRIVPGLVPLLIISVVFLAFFAFAGLVLFNNVPDTEYYFGSFGMAMWHLVVLQTTCNFPDVRSFKCVTERE